ncbi:WAT1-related protein [Platanthera zijinensis]|uniref:WAT1-related protein n=1 Tax=Platanthera zijinensis TaxID=2320716 RepID=A0AAP0BBT9_9ASPA
MESSSSSFENFLIIAGLLLVQGVYGFYTIFLSRILAMGLSPLFMIVAGGFLGAVFLLPFAVILERKKWPKRITLAMVVQFVAIALGGVTMFQGLLLMGIKRTTPAIASAMPNLVPGFVFIIAAFFRLEKFSFWCKYSQTKVIGTIVCLGGALAMSMLQTPTASKSLFFLGESVNDSTYKDWLFGCFYLLAAIIIVSFVMVLQATTMVGFPAPFTLCVITSLLGSILTGILQILIEGKLDVGSSNLSLFLIILVISGTMVSSTCVVYQTWCVSKKGPLLVSIFSPIQTLSATSLSMILFRQSVSLGSSIGMLLMVTGLYVVLWAKRKEDFVVVKGNTSTVQNVQNDIEKPLLS